MKKYEVISFFTDLRDYDHPYNVGDEFPRQGVTVSEERLAELSSRKNKQRRPLIRAVETFEKEENGLQGTVQSILSEQNVSAMPQDSVGNPVEPESTAQPTAQDVPAGNNKYSKEYLETLKLPEIREIAKERGFKISSTSKDGAVTEFMEKQG